MGVLPPLGLADAHGPLASNPTTLFQAVDVRLTAVVRAAQTAPDLVLRERVGRTRDYLFTTRIPDAAILGAQLVVAAASGCAAALAAMTVQLATGPHSSHRLALAVSRHSYRSPGGLRPVGGALGPPDRAGSHRQAVWHRRAGPSSAVGAL